MAAAAAAALGSLACAQGASAATTLGGGALAVQANLKVLTIPVDAGPLPAVTLPADGGGPFTAPLANTNVIGLVKIKSGNVSTQGDPDAGTVDSSATVADVDVLGLVKATVAASTCGATATSATGSSKVVDLSVAGIPVAIADLGPNTKITLPVATVTLNEQVTTASPAAAPSRSKARSVRSTRSTRTRAQRRRRHARAVRVAAPQSITVNAVHVHLDVPGLASGDVVLGQSRCSVG